MRRRPRIELKIVDSESTIEYTTGKHVYPTERQYEAARRLLAELVRSELTAVVVTANAFQGWPEGRPPRYNGSGTPCDMFVGPCCCGATHYGED